MAWRHDVLAIVGERLRYHSVMQRQLILVITSAILVIALAACSSETGPQAQFEPAIVPQAGPVASPNILTADEAAEGWRLLFNGSTLDGWRGLGRITIPSEHWVIENDSIRKVDGGRVRTASDGQPLVGGDLMTVDAYSDFELKLEWKVSPGGNSGGKYNVSEALSTKEPPPHAALGFEYQILDDDRHPDAQAGPNRTAAGLYDLIGPNTLKALRPVGEFNSARVVFQGMHGEHWLNGAKVLEFELESDEFTLLMEKSKYAQIAGFANRRTGHIVLQDHGNDAWFRNIKIRELGIGSE